MQIGNKNVELIWPGLFDATPAILLFVVMPCFLIYSLFKYSSASKLRKIAYIPLCILGPFLISGLIPLAIAVSGFYQVSDGVNVAGVFERYCSLSTIFGIYSNYVWTLFASFVVYGIYSHLKKTRKTKRSKQNDSD